MDKRHIAFLKERFPKFFYKVAGSYVLARIVTELDRFNYIKCILFKKPYFGTLMLAGQTWTSRESHMRALIEAEILRKGPQNGFNVLEMGTWAGNSAILWANVIKRKGVKDGLVVCVDAWDSYITEGHTAGVNKATLIMDRAARREKIFKLFLHNIKTSGHSDTIKPFKGFTREVLRSLRPGFFDLIYVDASHLYSGVLHDLRWALQLVRPGGIICGDDLELQKKDVDVVQTEEHKERDLLICPVTGREYHPGVTLAVAEMFGDRVVCQEGFWYVRR